METLLVKLASCVTSPPYEDSDNKGARAMPKGYWDKAGGVGHLHEVDYGNTPGQLGQEKDETYLDAMRLVFQQCFLVASVIVSVVKDPTRDGKLRLLGEDTKRLLQECGYQLLPPIHAILFEEHTQQDMFAGPVKKVKGRLSFFKRLSYQKGSPVANYEHVIVGIDPGRLDGNIVAALFSQPYGDSHQQTSAKGAGQWNVMDDWRTQPKGAYSDNPANIGNLRDRSP